MQVVAAGMNIWCELGPKEACNDVVIPISPSFPLTNLKSISIGFYNTVCTYRDGTVYMSGRKSYENELPVGKEHLFTDFTQIKNNEGYVIDIVSGDTYTVKHIAEKKLFFYGLANKGIPIQITLDNDPVFIKGCSDYFATIDAKGSVCLFSSNNINTAGKQAQIAEPIIDIAFLPNAIFALSCSGTLYISKNDINSAVFARVESLDSVKIIQISGYYDHILALAENGSVYAYGNNKYGQLGDNTQKSNFNNFTKVLLDSRCKQVATGSFHSLFLTEEGKVLSCGMNNNGQLLLGNINSPVLIPQHLPFNEPVSFIAAGSYASLIIFGEVPTLNSLTANIEAKGRNKNKSYIIKTGRALFNIINDAAQVSLMLPQIKIMSNFFGASHTSDKIRNHLEIQLNQFRFDLQECKQIIKNMASESQRLKESQTSHVQQKQEESLSSYVRDPKDFTIVREVGSGRFAQAFEVVDKQNKHLCMKKYVFNEEDEQNIGRKFMKEIDTQSQVRHPCVVQFEGFYLPTAEHPATLYLEFISNGSLEKHLNDKLSSTRKAIIIVEIVLGMIDIHSHGIIHRDLKPSNILMTDSFDAKIADFGESTYDEIGTMTSGVGTLYYMSPEMLNEQEYTCSTDVFSFGVILYQILTGNLPKTSLVDLLNGKRVQIPPNLPSFVRSLISKCWAHDAEQRPSFEQIYQILEENDFQIDQEVESNWVRDKIELITLKIRQMIG